MLRPKVRRCRKGQRCCCRHGAEPAVEGRFKLPRLVPVREAAASCQGPLCPPALGRPKKKRTIFAYPHTHALARPWCVSSNPGPGSSRQTTVTALVTSATAMTTGRARRGVVGLGGGLLRNSPTLSPSSTIAMHSSSQASDWLAGASSRLTLASGALPSPQRLRSPSPGES